MIDTGFAVVKEFVYKVVEMLFLQRNLRGFVRAYGHILFMFCFAECCNINET